MAAAVITSVRPLRAGSGSCNSVAWVFACQRGTRLRHSAPAQRLRRDPAV